MAPGDRKSLRPRDLLLPQELPGVALPVVIGGFALAPHGYVRATKDVDIVPRPNSWTTS